MLLLFFLVNDIADDENYIINTRYILGKFETKKKRRKSHAFIYHHHIIFILFRFVFISIKRHLYIYKYHII